MSASRPRTHIGLRRAICVAKVNKNFDNANFFCEMRRNFCDGGFLGAEGVRDNYFH